MLTLMYIKQYSVYIGMCIDALSRFSQAGQIFVSHSADPLVDVVEVVGVGRNRWFFVGSRELTCRLSVAG